MESVKSEKLIRLSKSFLGEREKLAVMGVLDRDFLGMGSEVQQFEQALNEFFGRKAICVASGTASLQLALEACNIGGGDEVLVQSLTYIASFQAISATGAKPIACDISPISLTLDLKDAEKRLTSKTKAIMPVHYSGGVGELDEIYAFADKHNLRVIEDAAHAFGTKYKGKRIGSFGDITCFSFDGIKNITSGEGGCIVSDDVMIIEKVKDSRLLGVQKDSEKRYARDRSWDFDVSSQGWRYHMSNIMAAIGLVQLENYFDMAKKRQRIALSYDHFFSDHKAINTIPHDYSEVVPHIYVVRISDMKNRNLLREKMLKLGIQTGVHYQPNHLLSFYKQKNISSLPVTDAIFPGLLSLPLHPGLNDKDVSYISKSLLDLV
jgi:dTDP-4-amino-4,6-dideoxygalactose transaminase